MSTIITKRCPHCGKVYDSRTYAGRPSKENQTQYGSPVRICPKCHKPLIDKDFREIAIDGIRDVDTKKVSPATIVYTCGLILFAFACLFTKIWWGVLPLAGAVWMFLSEYLGYGKRMEFFKKEQKASEERLQNPEYARLLTSLGYHVPDRYLKMS